uniref:Death domain-containing protein n=1 Tax=Amphimedon queenslandica TaxID=400682 RepID=A0A1X7US61_AMPQE
MAEPRHRPAILRLSGRHLDIRDLNEVVALLERHHCNKASYHRLGLSLLLSHNTLEKVEQEHRGQVDRCFTESLASWLRKADSVENPTLDTLIAALRGIGENAVADGITGERQRDPMQPGMTYNPGVRDLELKINEVSGLQEIAYKLQGQFDSLVLAVKKSLESHCNNIEDAKVLIKGCLKRKARVVAELMFCIDKLGEVNDFKSFFEFLSDYDFIGYLNYKLLKKLIVEFAKDDDEIKDRFIGYEEEYVKLLSAASFQNFIPFFEKNSDLSPTAPLGLPLISFRLEKPWLITSILTWVSTYGAFSWLEYAYLKQLRAGSIIITYAILPCVLDDVMRDLKNPVILRKLKDNDITVIELPQEEEETQLESTAKRKLISTGVIPIEKEVIIKNSSLGRELISSIEFHTKPEEVIGLLEAGADPNATEYASDRKTALIRAIDKNNIGIVKFLLEKGADPNIGSDMRKRTPLLIAVKSGSIETVDILLTNGARTNVVSKDGKTPLHYAGKSGKVEMLEFWIRRGDYDVNVKDKRKRTPLFNAVKSGSVEAVDFLLTNGASADVVDIAGTTPLHCAGKSGKVEMLEFWIKRGDYDVNVKDKRKRTPLFNAVKSGSIEAVNILLTNGARADVVSKDKETLLHCAGESGKVEMLEFWIKRGDNDVNVKNKRNKTPLFNAVSSGSIEAVDILLTNGARTDVVDKYDITPLHCASETGDSKIIKLLITKGKADVNAVDEDKKSPLFNAVKSGSIEAVDILLTNGARTDVVDKDGKTLLHCAGESGKGEMVEFWRGDYDVNVKDKRKRTPLFNAVESGSIEVIDILLTNGAKTDIVDEYDDTPLHCASETGNSKIIKLLITKGKADVNVVDKNKKTPLFNAVKSGSIEAVDILLTNGARTDVVDEDGETLLHCASESGEVEMLEFWISRGDYDVNVKDKRNRTPLFNALDRFNSSVEAVDILLTNGASTDVMDADDDSTPLHCASETGNCKIIKLLITKGKADVNAVDEKNRTPLFNAVEKGSIEAVNILLANGARTDVVSKDGKTLLHCAGESGEVEMLEFWIKKGDYDVNVKDEENKTPLFSALSRFNSSVEAVDILLTNGASTDVVDTSYSGTTPLHCAIETGSSKIIKLLITKGKADVNAVDKNNRTPLFKAVKKGNIQAVDILLTNGARTDVVDKDGETLLHCASESGEVEMLEFWIKKGDCDVNVKDERNRTPLFSALERFNSSVEAVDILLTNGAKTDVVDEHDDSTPLHCASETGDSKIIELLITKGEADVNAVDKKNRTPLFNAVKEGSIEAVEVLLTNGARTDVVDKDGETLLHCASESNEVEMLEFWIKRGDYDVNVTNKRNRTPLFNALDKYRCSIEAVDILLNNGARTDVVDTDDDSTPLHCASETGNSEIIKLLITKGKADVNAVDEDNKTPLFNAVKKGSIEVVEILLTNGAKTDVVDKDGETLLHCAAESGKVEMLEFWIKRGDHDVNAKDKRNRTPLFNALVKYRCSIEVVDILLTNGARTDVADTSAFDGSTPLHCAIQTGNSKIIKLLVTKGKADVNVVDEWKRTPLFKAVKKGNIEAVDILLTNGAKTDVVDKYGETLLHCAAESGKIEMLKFWIKRGDYDVNVLDKKKRTPLFNAVKEGSIEAVDILLTNGARTDVVDKDGETLLQCAGRSGNAEMLEFWISKRSKTNVADNLGALLKEFEGKVTREQAAAIYKSSGFSSDASMKCLKEGPTLESILSMLNQKMESAKSVVVTVHTDDMWRDIVRHYKSGSVDFGERLFIKLSNTLAIDAGGVRRQVYSTVYNEFHCNKHIELFTGPLHSLSPACTAEARSSGLFKILGSMVGHSIWQDGIGFPFFSLTNYTYIVEGEEKALQVCSDNDIGAGVAAVISKLQDIKTEDDGKEVMKDELILDIISRCGVTMIPNPSTKNIIVQDIITYEALFKHSKLLDQFVEGLKATSLYPLLRAFPALFQPLFTFTELTSEEVQKSLIFPNEDSFIAQESIILRYLKKYIDECDSEGLKEFALSITGRISVLPKSIEIKFEADRMGTIATHSCSGELIFPCQFEGDYEMFCSALKSVLTRDFNTY